MNRGLPYAYLPESGTHRKSINGLHNSNDDPSKSFQVPCEKSGVNPITSPILFGERSLNPTILTFQVDA